MRKTRVIYLTSFSPYELELSFYWQRGREQFLLCFIVCQILLSSSSFILCTTKLYILNPIPYLSMILLTCSAIQWTRNTGNMSRGYMFSYWGGGGDFFLLFVSFFINAFWGEQPYFYSFKLPDYLYKIWWLLCLCVCACVKLRHSLYTVMYNDFIVMCWRGDF